MVQDCGNRTADICLVMQAVGQAGHSLSVCDNYNINGNNLLKSPIKKNKSRLERFVKQDPVRDRLRPEQNFQAVETRVLRRRVFSSLFCRTRM